MRNLILLFTRYGATIIFVVLELFCFYLIVNYNQSQKEIWFHSANLFSGKLNEKVSNFNSYLSLGNVNDSLLVENAELLQTIINYRIFDKENTFQDFENRDSLDNYNLIPVGICGKTNNLRNNYLTICKGEKDGIRPGMGVMSESGIVGIVKNVSKNFSNVLEIIHNQSNISCSILNKDFSGNLRWNGSDARVLSLESIPKHAEISFGDTIITSGYSTAFPYGIPVGVIENFDVKGVSNTYDIDVRLFNDLMKLQYVYVIDYVFDEEKEEMLENLEDEQGR